MSTVESGTNCRFDPIEYWYRAQAYANFNESTTKCNYSLNTRQCASVFPYHRRKYTVQKHRHHCLAETSGTEPTDKQSEEKRSRSSFFFERQSRQKCAIFKKLMPKWKTKREPPETKQKKKTQTMARNLSNLVASESLCCFDSVKPIQYTFFFSSLVYNETKTATLWAWEF